jgi:hypothetical protein
LLAHLDLKSRLLACAERWAAAHGRDGEPAPLSRLGKAVAGDANFFERIAGGGGVNVSTLEKFARFLADPANWPGGVVPDDARAFAHVTGVSAEGAGASPGKGGDVSPKAAAA